MVSGNGVGVGVKIVETDEVIEKCGRMVVDMAKNSKDQTNR